VECELSAAGTTDGALVGSHSESIVRVAFKVGDNFTCARDFHLIPRHHFFVSVDLPIFKNITISFILFRMVPSYQGIVINFALFLIDLRHIYA
jgi:hypothetical protein